MANVPISKIQVPGSNDVLHLRDSTAANKVQSATNGNLAGLDVNGNLTDSGVSASSIGNLSGSHLGTCETEASTSAKIVTIGDGTWIPKEGDIIGVKFTYSNTALFVTLNVNGIGNKSIWYADSAYPNSSDSVCGKADSYIFYMYDGTYWIWLNEGQHDGNNFPSVAVYTASNQQVKIGTCNYYTLTNKSYCHFIFRYPNTCKDMLFMKINNSSSKTIYINGEISSSTNYTLPAGTYIAYYENDKWYFRTDGILPAKTTEGAEINERLDTTTTSASGNPISITGLKSNQLAKDPVITFEPIQAGSGDPSPSNIRAISGYDKIEVLSCGKNLFDGTIYQRNCGYTANGEFYNGYSAWSVALVKVEGLSKITESGGTVNSLSDVFLRSTTLTDIVSRAGNHGGSHTYDVPNGAKYFAMTVNNDNSENGTIQVEEGQTATTYEPYDKTTDLSEPLPQTVYGGSYNPRTGLFTVTWGYIASYAGETLPSEWISDRNVYASGTTPTTGAQVAYKLASANYTTIQLTPHEISLLKDYAYVSTNGTNISLDYHNGEIATLGDVSQLGETVNELGNIVGKLIKIDTVDIAVGNNKITTLYKSADYVLISAIQINSNTSVAGTVRAYIDNGYWVIQTDSVQVNTAKIRLLFTANI